jgi:hypothetical protein
MKRISDKDPDMRDEYDFTGAVVGRYAARFAGSSNVVVLDPDLAKIFTDSASVNRTLRAISQIVQELKGPGEKRRSRSS